MEGYPSMRKCHLCDDEIPDTVRVCQLCGRGLSPPRRSVDLAASGSEVPSTWAIRTFTAIIVLGSLLVLVEGWQIFHGTTGQRQRWDYTIESPPDGNLGPRLETLGAGAWELVSSRRATSDLETARDQQNGWH
jgi:hypothetical protein